MKTKRQIECIQKAKAYSKKHFLTEAFGKLYLKYCDDGVIPPQDFLEKVSPNRKVIITVGEVQSAIPIDEYFELHKTTVLPDMAKRREKK